MKTLFFCLWNFSSEELRWIDEKSFYTQDFGRSHDLKDQVESSSIETGRTDFWFCPCNSENLPKFSGLLGLSSHCFRLLLKRQKFCADGRILNFSFQNLIFFSYLRKNGALTISVFLKKIFKYIKVGFFLLSTFFLCSTVYETHQNPWHLCNPGGINNISQLSYNTEFHYKCFTEMLWGYPYLNAFLEVFCLIYL